MSVIISALEKEKHFVKQIFGFYYLSKFLFSYCFNFFDCIFVCESAKKYQSKFLQPKSLTNLAKFLRDVTNFVFVGVARPIFQWMLFISMRFTYIPNVIFLHEIVWDLWRIMLCGGRDNAHFFNQWSTINRTFSESYGISKDKYSYIQNLILIYIDLLYIIADATHFNHL